MAAIKKSISLPETQFEQARVQWERLGFTTFSDYIQHLIRRDLQEAQVAQQLARGAEAAALNDAARPAPPVSYRKTKRPKP